MSQIQIQLDSKELKEEISAIVKEALEEFSKNLQLQSSEDKIYTPVEAAEILSCNPSTVSNWRRDGDLGSWGLGGRVYVRQSDIDKALIRLKPKNGTL